VFVAGRKLEKFVDFRKIDIGTVRRTLTSDRTAVAMRGGRARLVTLRLGRGNWFEKLCEPFGSGRGRRGSDSFRFFYSSGCLVSSQVLVELSCEFLQPVCAFLQF